MKVVFRIVVLWYVYRVETKASEKQMGRRREARRYGREGNDSQGVPYKDEYVQKKVRRALKPKYESMCINKNLRGEGSLLGPPRAVIVTSTSHRAYADRAPEDTIWEKPPAGTPPIWVFHEDSWENAHGRLGIKLAENAAPEAATCMTDIFVVQSWLWDALKRNGPLDQFYAFAGNMEPCDQPLRIKSGKVLVRKIAAIHYALNVLHESTLVIWLDTDVFIQRPPDLRFYRFVEKYDMSYIAFTSNKGWGDKVYRNFQDIYSPYWRIESGVTVYRNTGTTRNMLGETIALYRGLLLKLILSCLRDMNSRPVCGRIWFQRNTYLDDIFVLSYVMHKHKSKAKFGWFSMGCGEQCPEYKRCAAAKEKVKDPPYFFSHVCQAQNEYTANWNLEYYFVHHIGSGAYSRAYRSGRSTIDPELSFELHERFNDTIELRFPGASLQKLEDDFWDIETRERRQRAGMWPADMQIHENFNPPVPRKLDFLHFYHTSTFVDIIKSQRESRSTSTIDIFSSQNASLYLFEF